jgi:hypothetical protein
MSEKSDELGKAIAHQTVNANTRNIIPFTGGLCFVIYAFFWPESYGHWLGTIVHSFRVAAGF